MARAEKVEGVVEFYCAESLEDFARGSMAPSFHTYHYTPPECQLTLRFTTIPPPDEGGFEFSENIFGGKENMITFALSCDYDI